MIIPEANIRSTLSHKWGDLAVFPLPLGKSWPKDNATALLLRSPLRVEGKIFCLAKIWKRHLVAVGCPTVKLITLGFSPNMDNHPNYIDLLNLPQNWQTVLGNALPASAEWQPLDTLGADLQQKLYRFLRGHDDQEQDSLVVGFTRLQQTMDALAGELKSGADYKETLEAIIAGTYYNLEMTPVEIAVYQPGTIWASFIARFNNYHQLFDISPIRSYFDQLAKCIREIDPFFAAYLQDKSMFQSTYEKITHIFEILDNLEKNYVK